MKFLETKFEEYICSCQKENLHPELTPSFNSMADTLNGHNNLILYGPPGTGKYTQVLNYIKKFSPTGLKYERKINIELCKKKQYFFKISDIHFEIDMELLGCNAKSLWNTIYLHILDILSTRQTHNGIIICKNFHKIHNELLDIFYSYMQTLVHKNICLSYIFITESVSFIPDNILTRCIVMPVKRPTKLQYKKCTSRHLLSNVKISKIMNIKDLYSKNTKLMDINKLIISKIIRQIEEYDTLHFLSFRDNLYDIFIYHLELNECLWEILVYFINNKKLDEPKMERILFFLYRFLKYFNNNYRPIYHLERFVLFLCKEVHEL